MEKMKKLVAYIRGGLGDIWPAISAIKAIMEERKIKKQDVTIISDSVYYFRDNYSSELEKMSLDMLHKITPNVITVPIETNMNFRLTVDDTKPDFSQENADTYLKEFMFWRPKELRDMLVSFTSLDTIFIDAFFTECIMEWDILGGKYNRVNNKRAKFEFNPPNLEKAYINSILSEKNLLIHVRKKKDNDGTSPEDEFYNNLIEFCNMESITPIVMGIDDSVIKGEFVNLRGESPLSFEGIGYLIDKCNVMLGNDSGFSAIKLYQQNPENLLIMNHPRWDRSPWYFRAIGHHDNCLLLDARVNNYEKIIAAVGDYYGKA